AYTYSMYEEDADKGNRHQDIIKEELKKGGFDYKEAEVTPIFSDNGVKLIKLSEYNSLIQSLGYPAETLSDLEGILTPGTVSEKNSYRIDGPLNDQYEVLIGKKSETVKVLKAETFIAVPATYGETLVVSDRLYEDAFQAQQD
ncbi:ABC transporter permease, partial [Clostridium perfringens]